MNKVEETLKKYGFKNIEECKAICEQNGINVDEIVKGVQPIAFDDATLAYTLGSAIAIKQKAKTQPLLNSAGAVFVMQLFLSS